MTSAFYTPHERVITEVGDESMADQSFKDECDINNILKQYQLTGLISHINKHKGEYVDLPDDLDYQNSINTVLIAQDAFATLPSKVRDEFRNDPLHFLAAFSDPSRRGYLEELGLLPKASAAPSEGAAADAPADSKP